MGISVFDDKWKITSDEVMQLLVDASSIGNTEVLQRQKASKLRFWDWKWWKKPTYSKCFLTLSSISSNVIASWRICRLKSLKNVFASAPNTVSILPGIVTSSTLGLIPHCHDPQVIRGVQKPHEKHLIPGCTKHDFHEAAQMAVHTIFTTKNWGAPLLVQAMHDHVTLHQAPQDLYRFII